MWDWRVCSNNVLPLLFNFFAWIVLWIGCNIIRLCFVPQLPPGARVSKDCRDLLLRLLERNPDARITFAEFFAHPFVDLEHMPSADSIVKAVRGSLVLAAYLQQMSFSVTDAAFVFLIFFLKKELVLQAVQKDQEGERSAALSFYCSALEHFVPAIYCKNNNYPHILSVPLCLWTILWLCWGTKVNLLTAKPKYFLFLPRWDGPTT